MASVAQSVIREPGAVDARQFGRRVYRLALVYPTLFVASIVGAVIVVSQGKLFVALAQRSNVETLTLAFFLIFFGYVAILSAPGARGALRIAYYHLRARLGNAADVERRKHAALGPPAGVEPVVALNVILERQGRHCEAFWLDVSDSTGSLGRIEVAGARILHRHAHRDGSNDLLAYFVHQTADILHRQGFRVDVEIVGWKKIDDEETEQYLGIVQFARNLERRLGAEELWPKVVLSDADCAELERRLAEICPALRDEAFLPDWEYSAEHKLPIVPEPLGLVSLSRSEKRVDPLASMGCAVFVVLGIVFVLAMFVAFPPWVPGT